MKRNEGVLFDAKRKRRREGEDVAPQRRRDSKNVTERKEFERGTKQYDEGDGSIKNRLNGQHRQQ